MGGSQKSKGVTWASDEYLCQVRLFLSEDSPSQVASSAQGHLQVKTSWASVSDGMLSDENLPPGFEEPQSAYTWSVNLSQIPVIKWKFPPKYVFDDEWKVVAGEESKEVEAQKRREMGNLEAIYPKPSDIPSDPLMLAGADITFHDDQECPVIPVIPIEDEDVDVEAEMINDSTALNTVPMSLQPQRTAPGTSFNPDVLAAAQTALTVLMRNNDQGNLIDHELLVKVLSDPKLIEQLSRNPGAQSIVQNLPATNGQRMAPPSATQGLHMPNMIINRLGATSPAVSLPASASYPMNRPEFVAPAPGGGFYPPPPNRSTLPPNVRSLPYESVQAPNAPVTKDINYYKNLIQQHGGERQDLTTHSGGVHNNQHLLAATSNFRPPLPRDLKQKIMKPCMYFNTSRGCRNGANCAFQHEGSNQQRVNNSYPDPQNAKRMKTEREITGT